MKILILYTYNKGLLSEFYQELSEKLSKDGYEVINFYLKHKNEYFVQNGVSIYGEKRGNFFQNYYHVFKIIKKTKPDIVISNFSFINPAIFFGRMLGIKCNIAWFHSSYHQTKPNKFSLSDFTFNPDSASELKEQLIPYLVDKGMPSDYFKSMHHETFDKKLIYE